MGLSDDTLNLILHMSNNYSTMEAKLINFHCFEAFWILNECTMYMYLGLHYWIATIAPRGQWLFMEAGKEAEEH